MARRENAHHGGQRLEGTVRVSGGKNTSVAVISASILSETPCVIENLPNIEDVNVSVETLRHLGAKVNWDPDTGVMEVDSSTIDRTDVPLELCRRMRASSYYIGALLARFGRRRCPCRRMRHRAQGRSTSTSRAARARREGGDDARPRRGADGRADRLGCVHGYGHRRRHDQRHAGGLPRERHDDDLQRRQRAAHRRSGELPQLDGAAASRARARM